mgnify:CR=1 FL=1
MKTFKAVISYDGRFYEGFQRQPNKETIQGILERELSRLLNKKTLIHGAGRTDSGVSAKGQVVSFKGNSPIRDLEKLRYAWNRLLPRSIFCSSLEIKDDMFDARHSCVGKRYSYSFSYPERNPLNAFESPLAVGSFDYSLFEKGMRVYEGKHDFKNFTTKKEDKDHFIRTLHIESIQNKDGHIRVLLSANGFMTYMVRLLVGAALKVATGKFALEVLESYLDNDQRKILSFKADPIGLVLEEVLYER